MKLGNLVSLDQLQQDIENGYITAREYHNKIIYNYTPKATYDGYWTIETVTCRGLICDKNQNVVARPFAKFFTIEQEQGHYHLCDEEGSYESTFIPNFNDKVVVTDKLDGSLGILWNDNGEPAISTRGRLDSEIALSFTQLLRSNKDMYEAARFMVTYYPWRTFLFELLDPEEHVIHYPKREIVYLGYVNIDTGEWKEACLEDSTWERRGLPIAQRLNCKTLAEALALPERENAEGMVIHFSDGKLIKFKQDSYLAARMLHYNWKKAFIAELEKTNFAQWTEYIKTRDIQSFNFSEGVAANKDEVESVTWECAPEIGYMICIWNQIFSLLEGCPQKEYALAVLNDSMYSPYKKFLFAARKYGKIDNLYPFNYIDLEY